MADDRIERLTEAQTLGLQGLYDTAFEILDGLLGKNPVDVAALRLKGNLLELKAMEVLEINRRKFTTSADYLAARRCYEAILQVDPEDAAAHVDLGDHYRNMGASDRALEYYGTAANILRKTPSGPALREDVEQLLAGVEPLVKHERLAREARSIEAWCREVLGASGSGKSA